MAAILDVMADPDSFVAFYREEAEFVLLFLTRRTFDAEVALDLTAETFAQAWRGWPKVRTDSREEMRAWLLHDRPQAAVAFPAQGPGSAHGPAAARDQHAHRARGRPGR